MKKRTVVGGRGHKVPYKTSIVRVPDPLVPRFEEMMTNYREKVVNQGKRNDWALHETFLEALVETGVDDYLINYCKEILEKKGTRKAALTKLLQVVLRREVKQAELD